MHHDIKNLILKSYQNTTTSWAIVRNGVVAEFSIVPEDKVESHLSDNTLQINTQRGSLYAEFDESISTIAAESGAHGCSPWTQNIHFAIPKDQAKMSGRDKLSFLGDFEQEDVKGKLWNLGVGNKTLDACIIADEDTHNLLKKMEGHNILDDQKFLAELAYRSPVRLFRSKFAAIMVKQKIPLSEYDSVEGPHTHLLPAIIRGKKQFPSPLPEDMESVIQVNPFVSVIDDNSQFYKWDGFEKDHFQELLQKHGDASYVSRKNKLLQEVLYCLKSASTVEILEKYKKDEQDKEILRIILAQTICDDNLDKGVRQKAFATLKKLGGANLDALEKWVNNIAPEIKLH